LAFKATSHDNLTDRIYEAAVLPELWQGVVSDLSDQAGGRAALLSVVQSGSVNLISTSQHFADTWATILHMYPGASNKRTQRLLARRHPGFLTDIDVFGPAEIGEDPLYAEILVPRGYGSGVATAIHFPDGAAAVINIEQPAAAGPFGRGVIQQLDALRPHLARSALLSARLGFERARTAVQTLEGLGFAACAVQQSGSVILANQALDGEQALWTTRGGDRIALLDGRADKLLGETLRLIDSEAGVRSIPLRGGPEASPAVLHVVPIRRAAHDLFGQATAILVLTKSSTAPTNRTPLLQALFDLSPTEAAIAARVAAGQSVEEIARADAKSGETVRNQLKSVFAKTGCRRQLDLTRMLVQMVGG
jgi:DNA-binding CsgD family transcriptional regulator